MTKAIIGEKLQKPFDELGIKARCAYHGSQGGWHNFEVWEISDNDLARLNQITDAQWQTISDNDDSWYRYADGSIMGCPNGEFIINGRIIDAWQNEAKVQDLMKDWEDESEDEQADYEDVDDYIRTWSNYKYNDLLSYLCDELGASTEKNVCALCVDLAKWNGMTMAELFKTYGEKKIMEKIEHPWAAMKCANCIFCHDEDMCSAYHLGMSNAYCPQVRNCEKYKEKSNGKD